jgi:HMG (high mobility group) box
MNFYSPPLSEVAFNQYYTSCSQDIFLSQPLSSQSSFFDQSFDRPFEHSFDRSFDLKCSSKFPELDGSDYSFEMNATISLPELDGTLQDPLLKFDYEPVSDLPETSSKQSTFQLSNLPKRPPNAFILFRRSLVMDRNKSLSFVEFSKSAGIRWKEMTADEKKGYEQEANALRQKFKLKYPGFKVKYKSRGKK